MPVSLAAVSKLLLHVSARDKIVKFLQYVSRILLGFYGSYLTEKLTYALQQVKDITSLSRRAFRLLKSFDHLHRIVLSLPNLIDVDDKPEGGLENILIESVSILEQFSLMVYYAYENYLLLVSTRLLRIDPVRESTLRNESSVVSFVGNVARCIAACLRINRVQRLTGWSYLTHCLFYYTSSISSNTHLLILSITPTLAILSHHSHEGITMSKVDGEVLRRSESHEYKRL